MTAKKKPKPKKPKKAVKPKDESPGEEFDNIIGALLKVPRKKRNTGASKS